MSAKLTEAEIEEHLPALIAAGWTLGPAGDRIVRSYEFANFVEAFGFLTRAAIWAEKWNHHPEWSNVYRRVEVALTTHDAKGLTELDLKLARKMDALAGSSA